LSLMTAIGYESLLVEAKEIKRRIDAGYGGP
jgi:hypothetical protein